MLNTPFSPWPDFTQEEADAVSRILLSNKVNYWTGTECREFEKEFAAWCGVDYAIALANGTVALDLALKALGIGSGDEVVVTPRTFIASVSCVVNAGAVPIFADVDINSCNISAETISRVLTKKTKAIICVHLAGWPCDMDPIMDLAKDHNLYVIEDCAQAHGAKYKNRSVGSIGHVGAWSFCQDKIMTTGGEGGMVTTNNKALWSSMWSFKDHGKNYDACGSQVSAGFRWLHDSFGTNWRMIEMQAVIGRIQLQRMQQWHVARAHNAELVWVAARTCPLFRVPELPKDVEHGFYKCYVFIRPELLKFDWNRDRILLEISIAGVPCYPGSCSEVYLEKAFQYAGLQPQERLPIAQELGETSVMFLVHPTLTIEEINKTIQVILEVGARAVLP